MGWEWRLRCVIINISLSRGTRATLVSSSNHARRLMVVAWSKQPYMEPEAMLLVAFDCDFGWTRPSVHEPVTVAFFKSVTLAIF